MLVEADITLATPGLNLVPERVRVSARTTCKGECTHGRDCVNNDFTELASAPILPPPLSHER